VVELDPSPIHGIGPNSHWGRVSARSRIRKDGFAMSQSNESFVGIDIAKKHLDVCLLPERRSFQLSHDEKGLKD
jgi:hypothetical protein